MFAKVDLQRFEDSGGGPRLWGRLWGTPPLIVVSRHVGQVDSNIIAGVYAHLLWEAEQDQTFDVFGGLCVRLPPHGSA
jgi:hypothetical protein